MQALRAYLLKSDDQLIIPYIVAEEIEINYQSALKRLLKETIKTNKELSNISSTAELKMQVKNSIVFYESELKKISETEYKPYIYSLIPATTYLNKINYNLNSLISKALIKERPFNESGTGFKDALIWQEIIAYGKSVKDNRLIFISKNVKDFGESVLFEVLADEARREGVDIFYYNDLDAFIADRFESIKNIELDPTDFDSEMLKILTSYWIKNVPQEISYFLEQRSRPGKRYLDFYALKAISVTDVKEYTVKDLGGEAKYIHGTIGCQAELIAIEATYSLNGNEPDHQLGLGELETDLLIVFTMKLENETYDELEILDVLFP